MSKNEDGNKPRSNTTSPSKRKQKSKEYLEYQRYIRSKEFQVVKDMVKERDGYKCMVCGRTEEEGTVLCVHHRSYEHLFAGDETEAADCITLCQADHRQIHLVKSNMSRYRRKPQKPNT